MAITLTRESIDRMEAELDERYRREKGAIQFMRQMLEKGEAGGAPPASVNAPPVAASLPPLETTADSRSFAGKIEEVCEEFREEQWTMRRMLAYLRQIDFKMGEKPEGTISAAMGKLAASGKLKIVRRGIGSSPNIYQWAGDDVDSDTSSQDDDVEGEAQVNDESIQGPVRPALVAREALG